MNCELTVKLEEIHKCSQSGHIAECTQLHDSKINFMDCTVLEGIYTERIDANGKLGVVQQCIGSVCDCLKMQVAWK